MGLRGFLYIASDFYISGLLTFINLAWLSFLARTYSDLLNLLNYTFERGEHGIYLFRTTTFSDSSAFMQCDSLLLLLKLAVMLAIVGGLIEIL